MSSYSKEELEEYKKEYEETNEKFRKFRFWITLQGDVIPIVKIKDDHLKNILKHLEERIKRALTPEHKEWQARTYKRFEKEFLRRVTKTKAGQILYGRKTV